VSGTVSSGRGIQRQAEGSLVPGDNGAGSTTGRRRRKVAWVIVVVVVAVVAGVTVAVTDPFKSHPTSSSGVVDNSYPTSLATVKRETISSQTPVGGTLGYAGSYGVVNQASGTYTMLPAPGQVVSEGQVLYRVSGAPVVLLYGSTPAYRTLSDGASGPDAAELNTDLVALGYATASELPAGTDTFGYWTKVGVEKLQAALGLTENGTLTLGQAVLEPSAMRVTTVSGVPGGGAEAGQVVLSATSTTREVTVDLDTSLQSEVNTGDQVTITLPDGTTTPGVVTSVGSVATTPSSSGGQGGPGSGSDTPTVTVEAKPTDPAATGTWDQAPVQVSITTQTVPGALVVPVEAVIALSGGGYAVEVVDPVGLYHLVDVNLGVSDTADNTVQVSGSGLAAGQPVVVPGT
jgi:hypothetical protein